MPPSSGPANAIATSISRPGVAPCSHSITVPFVGRQSTGGSEIAAKPSQSATLVCPWTPSDCSQTTAAAGEDESIRAAASTAAALAVSAVVSLGPCG